MIFSTQSVPVTNEFFIRILGKNATSGDEFEILGDTWDLIADPHDERVYQYVTPFFSFPFLEFFY